MKKVFVENNVLSLASLVMISLLNVLCQAFIVWLKKKELLLSSRTSRLAFYRLSLSGAICHAVVENGQMAMPCRVGMWYKKLSMTSVYKRRWIHLLIHLGDQRKQLDHMLKEMPWVRVRDDKTKGDVREIYRHAMESMRSTNRQSNKMMGLCEIFVVGSVL